MKENWIQDLIRPRMAIILALIGGLIYVLQSWTYAHSQESILDEGAYLLKGFLFAINEYTPYQDYGPWTNHMPLSFLIPGYIQHWLDPGLRTGRYFAIFLGVLFLIGLWITSNRLGGIWWATASIWIVALNPALIKMYSVASSQSLIATMLIWVMALILGEDRSIWKLVIGAMLAGALMMTRINMTPVMPLVLIYIFWQHGRKAGFWATFAGFGLVFVIHAIYWPGILKMWAAWLPKELVPFLNPWRPPKTTPSWNPVVYLDSRILSFLHGLRFHFVALLSVLSTLLLWRRREKWKNLVDYKMAIFLAVLFNLLLLAHFYAALVRSYCVFCFPLYLSFFEIVGVLLLIVSVSSWRRQNSLLFQFLVVGLVLSIFAGLGYGVFNEIGEILLTIQVPRIREFRIQPGYVELWGLFANRFGLSYDTSLRLFPTIAGLLLGSFVLGLVSFARALLSRLGLTWRGSFIHVLLLFILVFGSLLSPTSLLSGGYSTYDCAGDVISSYEEAGSHLRWYIPTGSTIYWQGVLSSVPLLYLDHVKIFPAQINLDYSYRLAGNDLELEQYGLWNESLGRRWLGESDFVLVAERYYFGWLRDSLSNNDLFIELPSTPSVAPCDPNMYIRVFRRVQKESSQLIFVQ